MAFQRGWMVIAAGAVVVLGLGIAVVVVRRSAFETVAEFVTRVRSQPLPYDQATVDQLVLVMTGQTWVTNSRLLAFKQGWATIDLRTVHADEAGADAIVLRSPDGRAWVSTYHACDGLPLHDVAQPRDLDDFLALTFSRLAFRQLP